MRTIDAPPVVAALHGRAAERFGELVHAIPVDAWSRPTPCTGWTVRQLVNHVAAENLWSAPLLAGRTIEDVGDAFDGDVLGAVPVAAWDEAIAGARTVIERPGALVSTVHLSFGETPATEYVWQLFADHLVHGWDLAQALGVDDRMDAELVAACATWFDGVEEAYRAAGPIGVPVGADEQGCGPPSAAAPPGRSSSGSAPPTTPTTSMG